MLAEPPNIDRQFLTQFLRRDTGVNKCGFRFTGQGAQEADDSRPARRGDPDRGLQVHGSLDPGADRRPRSSAALHEAEASGLPIVLLDASLPASSPGKYYPSVAFTGFPDAGKKIVETVLDVARSLNRLSDEPIVVLEYVRGRTTTARPGWTRSFPFLRPPAGSTCVLTYDGDQTAAQEAAERYLNDHPKALIILSDHDFGIVGTYLAFAKVWKANSRLLVRGGYAACDARIDDTILKITEAVGDRNIEGYARKALELAPNQMESKPVPERVELPIRIIQNPPRTPPVWGPRTRGNTNSPRDRPIP